MEIYNITEYTYTQAKKLNVEVKPSTNKKKKIDVFKDGKKIASIGARGYSDYPTYIKTKGKSFADKRRKAYRARHEHTRHKKFSNSWLASNLLW